MRVPLVYKEVPQFGFDIGAHTVKVVQLRRKGHKTVLQGYGSAYFDRNAIAEGIIVDPEELANGVRPLLKKLTYGRLTAKKVIAGLPASKLFTRTLTLPTMSPSDLNQAIQYEVGQYVPVPITDLYIDYETIAGGKDGQTVVLMMAAPRAIVDSYIKMFDLLGLQVGAIEASMTAVVRSVLHSGDSGGQTLAMDIGSSSSDITIYDRYIPLTASVPVGGETYTQALTSNLGLKPDQATEIKVKFGIGKSDMHDQVQGALDPKLQTVVKEAKRIIKFYQERGGKDQKVQAVVLSGGTAAMPGMAAYMEKQLGLPLKVADPWRNIETSATFDEATTQPPMFTTAVGLALRGLL